MFALRILLVDDDARSLRALARLLEKAGYEVHAARTFADAVTIADDEPIDLLITDLGLSDGHGNDLMRCIREKHDIPGIALSGYDREESRGAGFFAHLVKPVSFEKLLSAINAASPVVRDGHCCRQSEAWIG